MTRVSCEPDDPGFTQCKRCRVWLAGSERKNVVTADEALRYAEVFKLNEHGLCQFDKAGEVMTEEFHGEVVVVCPCKGDVPWRERSTPCSPESSKPLFSPFR